MSPDVSLLCCWLGVLLVCLLEPPVNAAVMLALDLKASALAV